MNSIPLSVGKMAVTITRLSSQSWFRISADSMIIDIDPAYYGTEKRGPDAYQKSSLVLITHGHRDHCDKNAIADICVPETVVAGPEGCLKGLPGKTRPIKAGEELVVGSVKVKAVDAYNKGLRGKLLHKKGVCNGYLVSVGGITVYHAGDSDLIPEMGNLGQVDVALLPIAGMVTMNASEAGEAAMLIKPRIVIPMHQLRASPEEFRKNLGQKAPGIKVVLLGVGQSFEAK